MKKISLLLSLAVFLLLFGCTIKIDTQQEIKKDGKAYVRQAIDISSLLNYTASLGGIYGARGEEEPDYSYSPQAYSNYPSFESQKIELTYSPSDLKELRVGGSASLSMSVKNLGEDLSSLNIYVKSKALVPSYSGSLDEFVGGLKKRESQNIFLSGEIANVSPGTYEFTVIAEFDRGSQKELKAAKTFTFEVREKKDELAELDKTYQELCANYTRKDPALKCSYNNGIFKLEKEISPDGDTYKFEKKEGLFETTYEAEISMLPQLVKEESSSTPSLSSRQKRFSEGLGQDLSSASSLFQFDYTIKMPAKITSAPNGKISDDKTSVTYDVLKLYEKKENIRIVAVEENETNKMIAFGAIGVVAIALVGGAAYLLLRNRPEQPPSQPMQ
ncbi:MAG: hypothetical protein N3G22_01335 [Candidatus Micrarchaeota archaeon]|nr:hypothetical protein [Candidatus Micrarchaeota archaeon]